MTIHKKEATRAKIRPMGSTLNLKGRPGKRVKILKLKELPDKTSGNMLRTRASFRTPARIVHVSLRLGLLVDIIKGTAQSDIRTTHRGLME